MMRQSVPSYSVTGHDFLKNHANWTPLRDRVSGILAPSDCPVSAPNSQLNVIISHKVTLKHDSFQSDDKTCFVIMQAACHQWSRLCTDASWQ